MAPGARSLRYRLFGLLGVALLGLSVFVVVASYNQMFVPVVKAEVIADRSGLLLDRRADVTLHGITIGEARNIDPVDGKAVIEIAIDRKYANSVPGNVTARITAPTVFGAKFIDLVPPPSPSPDAIAAGALIHTDDVATETNSVFDNLMGLLTTVQPAKLDATLGAVATALRGHGADLRQFISDLNTHLTRFTPTLPALDKDLAALPDVAGTYADVAPEITRILSNTTTTAQTIQEKETGLGALMLSLSRTSDDGRSLLNDHGQQLINVLDTMRPTSQLMAYFSPEFPCTFATTNALRWASIQSVGGQYNGIHGVITFMPGQPGYQKGADDPKLVTDGGPHCFPALQAYGPHYEFPDGTTTPDFYRQQTTVVDPLTLVRQMLGPGAVAFVDRGGK